MDNAYTPFLRKKIVGYHAGLSENLGFMFNTYNSI